MNKLDLCVHKLSYRFYDTFYTLNILFLSYYCENVYYMDETRV